MYAAFLLLVWTFPCEQALIDNIDFWAGFDEISAVTGFSESLTLSSSSPAAPAVSSQRHLLPKAPSCPVNMRAFFLRFGKAQS